MKAIWKGATLAAQLPPESIRAEFFQASDTHTHCFWKGEAGYYDVVETNKDAAWLCPDLSDAAQNIKGSFAFWHSVKVEP